MSGIKWIDLFFFPLKIAYVPDQKSWDKYMKKMGWPESYPKAAGHCMYGTERGQGYIFFAFNGLEKHSEIECEGLIAHEVTHAVDFIFEHVGEKNPGMETRAYLTQRLYMELRGFINLESRPS